LVLEKKTETSQAEIDTLFEADKSKPVHDRICEYAKRGVDAPETLSHLEVQQVCYALVVHYAQMGIG
jgi:hypothetical protein